MIREMLYSEIKVIAAAVGDYILHLGSDMDEALRMALTNVDGIMVRPDCPYTLCDHGTGLAGGSGCPGKPDKQDCEEFTQEHSKEVSK